MKHKNVLESQLSLQKNSNSIYSENSRKIYLFLACIAK